MVHSATVGIAVVGAGGWGRNIVRAVGRLGALRAIVDPHTERASELARPYDARVLELDQALADPGITAFMIAAPAHLHAALAETVLRAGRHVYVEKPLALSTADGRRLVELAAMTGRLLMVGHLMQYHNAFLKLLELTRRGDFGRLIKIYSNRLNMGKIRHEEDALWSLAPHDISMILALAGETPDQVVSHSLPALRPGISDTTLVHLDFASGLKAHLHVSWLHPTKEQRLVLVGSEGMAVFDDREPWDRKLAIYRHKVDWVDGSPVAAVAEPDYLQVEEAEPLEAECRHFIACVTEGRQPRTDGHEGLAVLAVLERASREEGADTARTSADDVSIHPTAVIDSGVTIGKGSKIWHFSHVLGGVTIGENCVLGQNVVAGPNVTIGDRCKIQNNVSLYDGVRLADGVFCGPSCVFTNVVTPRAEYERKSEFLETPVGRGATIGANATIVCGNRIGAYALVAAGAVVTSDVPAHALVMGVPARQTGWVSHAGRKLGPDLVCPEEKRRYRLADSTTLEEIA